MRELGERVMAETAVKQPEPILVTVEEAARMCRISRSVLYELIASREIPSVKIGASRRIPVSALREWVAKKVPV
jgi:excisionase family DNA binding protein